MQQKTHLVTALPSAFDAFLKYSKIVRMNQTTARMKDPKARLPPLYLKIQKNPLLIFFSPSLSVLWLKYQMAQDTIMTN